ncbi:MAG: hypothetical protein QM817_36625 [Archangium sp.]
MRRFVLVTLFATSACFPQGPALVGDQDPRGCDETFDDHSHKGRIDGDTFARMAETAPGENPQRTDFVVVSLNDADYRHVRFEDGSFYEFHDQWYWFRLINGVSACGSSANPVTDLPRFETLSAVSDFLKGKVELPLDLARASGGRYVSPSFYTLAFDVSPRVYAPGTMFRRAGETDRWWFEFEATDAVKENEVIAAHRVLEDALPPGSKLFWRAITPQQSNVGSSIEHGLSDMRDRVLRLGEEPP